MILKYDGSFEGFLSLVYDVYYDKLSPSDIVRGGDNFLFSEYIEIKSSEQKSEKVFKALKKSFPTKYLNKILNTFMCDTVKFELELLNYIVVGFSDVKNLDNISNRSILFVDELEKKFYRYIHKMYGFLRFEELGDKTLYAKFEAKYNILWFLGNHFQKRLGSEKFIIHDIGRGIVFLNNSMVKGVYQLESFDLPSFSSEERDFKKLWKTFFNNVTITERINIKLQKQLVPLIYREYMTEFQI